MLRGVLTKVMEKPFLLSICSANARNGIMWPCAMKGNITTSFSDLLLDEDGVIDDLISAIFSFMNNYSYSGISFSSLLAQSKVFYDLEDRLLEFRCRHVR